MQVVAKVVSYIFHPLLVYLYLIYLGFWIAPYAFDFAPRGEGLFYILSFMLLVIFPGLASVLMRRLELTKSLEMHDRQERIGPLIAGLIFYIWYFINLKNDSTYPEHMVYLSLGGVLSLSFAFFINNFSKISLHTVGAGALLMGVLILIMGYERSTLVWSIGAGTYHIGPYALMTITLLIAGAIGSARLLLGAHRQQDVYGGYMAGALAMVIAYRVTSFISLA